METTVPRGVEADAFFAFNNLMSETKDLFIQQMDDCTTGLSACVCSVHSRRAVLEQLHEYLEKHVPKAAAQLVPTFASSLLERTAGGPPVLRRAVA